MCGMGEGVDQEGLGQVIPQIGTHTQEPECGTDHARLGYHTCRFTRESGMGAGWAELGYNIHVQVLELRAGQVKL